MQTKVLSAYTPNAISHTIDVLANGGVVAFPTDTVYGLGALAFDVDGIDRLYFIKGRDQAKSIAVLLSKIEELERLTPEPSEEILRLANRFWPGPLTMVVERSPDMPESLSSSTTTIGLRIPDHPVALDLLNASGPMAVTSANLSGEDNASTAEEVLKQLDGRIHLVLDGGRTPGGVPSTVVDLTTSELKVLREGPIKEKDMQLRTA
ncbi:MAG: threonylcarbamoyl-AMP synthase [Chloroflexi bacterium]|nr:MAG: threonylcarbamoyl-AMP synthase [Chloroflexota bacterium]MBL1195228.1 threonylcarbamoyl-AMP synthase [Chloroflexota bacterium]NOH12513.1 threonylcarbamoyl-AMP synthase [Chloroflexota bacterium]